MNDFEYREVPDDMGYSLAFILSIGVHGLLACAFWIGAGIHSSNGNAAATVKNSPAQLHAIPTLTSSGDPLLPSGQIQAQPRLGDVKTALSIHTGTDKLAASLPSGAAKTKATEKSADGRNQKSHITSAAPPRPPSMNAKKFADASSNKPRLKKEISGKSVDKARLASTNGSTKDRHTANVRKTIVKQTTNKRNVAEIRKLESMREAELRRISKNLS